MIEIVEGVDEAVFAQVEELWAITGVGRPQRMDTIEVVRNTIKLGGRFYTAREGDRVVGACWLSTDGRRVFVHHMAVHPEYQNCGIGRMLLEIAIAYGDKLGMRCKLEVHRDNQAARHLYESCDFTLLEGYDVLVRYE